MGLNLEGRSLKELKGLFDPQQHDTGINTPT